MTVPAVMETAEVFMASVHPAIRWPDRPPPGRGGHLVLVTAARAGAIVFHNPSGHDRASQESVALPIDGFFAGRGVAIAPGKGTPDSQFVLPWGR